VKGRIVIVFDEIEERAEIGVAGMLGKLFVPFGQLSEKG
jgi:hypothetical protein